MATGRSMSTLRARGWQGQQLLAALLAMGFFRPVSPVPPQHPYSGCGAILGDKGVISTSLGLFRLVSLCRQPVCKGSKHSREQAQQGSKGARGTRVQGERVCKGSKHAKEYVCKGSECATGASIEEEQA